MSPFPSVSLPSGQFQAMLDQFYSKQEVMKISEAMDTPYYQRYNKKHKLLIYYLVNKLEVFRKQRDQIIKQTEEEIKQSREKYNDKQHKILINSVANGMKVSR